MTAVLMVGGPVMSFHYTQIAELYGGFPLVLAIGLTETGKSTAIKVGLSLFGMAKESFYVQGSTMRISWREVLSTVFLMESTRPV